MLRPVDTPRRQLSEYRPHVAAGLLREVRQLGRQLRGARILHVNSSETGGGVAEILRSEIPLLRGLGIRAEWRVVDADGAFFDATKKIHNALQGARTQPTGAEWQAFDRVNRGVAQEIDGRRWDYVIIHDPQPSGVLRQGATRRDATWIWRCHIDSERPHGPVLRRLRPAVQLFDGAVFSRRAYVFAVRQARARIVSPAIDPLAPKNARVPVAAARRIVRRFGIDPARPLLVQVSRFDPWKDQPGTVEAWRIARRTVRGLQLALVGCSADDDPESASILAQIKRQARGRRDVFVLDDRVDDRSVQAFLVCADVVIQKSLREGFGLTVTEALWAGRPVVGGKVGGIPLQVRDGREGFLVDDPRQAARRIVELCQEPEMAARLGRAGRLRVRRRFLLPRLVRDELRYLLELKRFRPSSAARAARGQTRRMRARQLGQPWVASHTLIPRTSH